MKYEDFLETETPNTCWGWVEEEDNPDRLVWEKFVANNAVAGDTDSIMLTLSDLFPEGFDDLEEITESADIIGDTVNDNFPKLMKHAFNIPDDRLSYMRTTREVVWDKALFLSKKRYIMHIIDDEGKSVDKLKIQGVEIIKSDTPVAVKNMLMELVNMILDNRTMEDTLARVRGMREEYQTLPIFDIAIPCNTKTLSKITKMYKETGSLKGAHYAAKAAFMWNMNKTVYDEEIFAGEKVGIVYVKHRDFNAIGYPIDSQTLPEWFLSIPVDYDKMWTAAYKKITNYLKSVGWDMESRKEEARHALFGF